TSAASGEGNVPQSAPPSEAVPKAREAILDLARRAEQGDKAALPALREVLKEPAAVDLLGGDLARQAQRALINKICAPNLLFQESLTRKLELLRDELAGPAPAPLELLLVERVVACWLHLHHLEAVCAQKDSMSLELGNYYHRNLDRAQKRYLSA